MTPRVKKRTQPGELARPASFHELDGFYRAFFLPLVRRAVRRHSLSFEDAGDVVQDAFILAISKLDPDRNPKAWLYQVVDHLATNLRRKAQRRAGLFARWQDPRIHLGESDD